MATNTNNYNSRIALITGGTKGIGLEVARLLAQKGIEILVCSRDEIRGEKVAEQLASESLPVTYIQIDVTNQSTIDLAVTEVANAYGRLDILINNSNIYLKEPRPCELTLEMIRQHFEVNFFGAFAVVKAFLPLLRQSSSGQIINVTSPLGSFYHQESNRTSPHSCAYSASKSALNMLTLLLAKDLKGTKIKINAYALSSAAIQLTYYQDHAMDTAVKSISSLATLFDDDGPTGKIFGEDNEEDKW